jgi:hypothetical protein
MKPRSKHSRVAALLAISLLLRGCTASPPALKHAMVEVLTDSMKNGYLIEIHTRNPVGSVNAFISRERWLIVTIVDSTLTTDKLESYRSPIVDSVEVAHFRTSLKLAFRLTLPVDAAEVIHENPSRNILISLFASPRDKGDRPHPKR